MPRHRPLALAATSAVACLLAAAPAHAVLGPNYFGAAYEAFDYPAGTTLGTPSQTNGGAGFNAAGSGLMANDADAWWGNTSAAAGVPPTTSVAAARSVDPTSLSYSAVGYAPPRGGKAVLDGTLTNVTAGVGRTFKQEVSAGVFWFSFLTERNNDTSRTTNLAFFGPVTTPSQTPAGTDDRFAIGQLGIAAANSINTGGNFSLHFNGANPAGVIQSPTPIAYGTNLTHLIVGRGRFDNGDPNAVTGGVNDTVSVWIDPTDVTSIAALGAPYLESSNFDVLTISAIRLFAGGLNTPGPPNVSTDFDEIRLGRSLPSVTVPEPTSLAAFAAAALVVAKRRKTNVPVSSDRRRPRFLAIVALAVAAALVASPARAVVIDDFTVGAIALQDTIAAGGAVNATQTALDSAHVAGGVRNWHFIAGQKPISLPPSSAVRMSVTTDPTPHYAYDADPSVAAVDFVLIYDANDTATGAPGINVDLAAARHNIVILEFAFINLVSGPAHFDVLTNTPNQGGSNIFLDLPNSPTPYRAVFSVLPSFVQPASKLSSLRLGSSDGNLFGAKYQIDRILTASSADADFDGDVDADDFLNWQRNLGQQLPATSTKEQQIAKGDANFDLTVNAADLTILRNTFSAPSAVPTGTTVPEPASLALFATAALITSHMRRNRP